MPFLEGGGIKQIYIYPDLNYGAALHADKWIPVYPNTDAALNWRSRTCGSQEGTYNREYVDTHVVGFDKFKAYVMGEEDGVAKTPKWASPKCGVPVWTIKALAREFARLTTSIGQQWRWHDQERLLSRACEAGGLSTRDAGTRRTRRARDTYRMIGLPRIETASSSFLNPDLPERLLNPAMSTISPWQEQIIPKTLLVKAIESDEPISFMGTSAIESQVKDQFKKYTYPLPKAKGGTEIHMIWSDTPCRPTCWNGGHKVELSLRNPKIETIVTQHPWMENECYFSDIILPISTFAEEDDLINNVTWGIPIYNVLSLKRRSSRSESPRATSKPCLRWQRSWVWKRRSPRGIPRGYDTAMYEILHVEERCTFEELKEKKYMLYNYAEDWEQDPPAFRLFYDDPEKNPLPTPTGKLEYYSERLAQNFPDEKKDRPARNGSKRGLPTTIAVRATGRECFRFLS